MAKSSDYLKPAIQRMLDQVDERDQSYGLAWRDPGEVPLAFLDVKLQQKSRGVHKILNDGQIVERRAFLDEILLDLLGYAAMISERIFNENE